MAEVAAFLRGQNGTKLALYLFRLFSLAQAQAPANADTVGVFQLESEGIKQLLYKMKPNQFEDICAILALYRPGPMHNIDEYIERTISK